jgi:malic enzyme
MSHSRGKVEVATRVALDTPDDLAEHYTPGVADQATRVADDPSALARETVKGNSVAIVSDGSALLGLGDRGPGDVVRRHQHRRHRRAAVLHRRAAAARRARHPRLPRRPARHGGRRARCAAQRAEADRPRAGRNRHAAVVATGRSDFPNQIDNVLAFPGCSGACSIPGRRG